MQKEQIKNILEAVKNNTLEIENAMQSLSELPFQDIGIAMLDHHRTIRTGQPEVVYGEGKSIETLEIIVNALLEREENIFITKLSPHKAKKLLTLSDRIIYNKIARTMKVEFSPLPRVGKVVVVSAGTSDIPIVEEVVETLSILGNDATSIVDVGVAGIHRLFAKIEEIRKAKVIIVVAGMEGALASVIGGIVKSPVIAVPTSVGYGASLNGISALLSMINSCTPNVVVVNIDNGFGAGYFASIVNHI